MHRDINKMVNLTSSKGLVLSFSQVTNPTRGIRPSLMETKASLRDCLTQSKNCGTLI